VAKDDGGGKWCVRSVGWRETKELSLNRGMEVYYLNSSNGREKVVGGGGKA